jgi:hypothetical protein
MYTGHIAVVLGAERHRRRVPLVVLLLASQAPDWIEQFLAVLGYGDRAQLWSHSIPAVLTGVVVVSLVYAAIARDIRGASLLAFVYLTHPVLDLVTGSKPLWPGGKPVGACLYNRPMLDWLAECTVLLIGWVIYRGTLGPNGRGRLTGLLLAALVSCQTGIDIWQAFRIYRAPEVATGCQEAAAR